MYTDLYFKNMVSGRRVTVWECISLPESARRRRGSRRRLLDDESGSSQVALGVRRGLALALWLSRGPAVGRSSGRSPD